MEFKGLQKTMFYKQQNNGPIDKVFPLLCPVREKDWLDGWDYKMIHSKSGLIEKDCVFTTPHHGALDTVWQVTQHDPLRFRIEFLRVTPGENVVKIQIALFEKGPESTEARITYKYTALSDAQNKFLKEELESQFKSSMEWWEKAINYYLKNGVMLIRTES